VKRKKLEKMNFKIYFRLLGYTKKYLKLIIICILLSFLISLLHFASLSMINPLGDILFNPEGQKTILKKLDMLGEFGISIKTLIETHVLQSPYTTLWYVMIIALVLIALKNMIRFFQEYLTGYVTNRVMIDVSNQLFARVERLPTSYFSREGMGEIASRFVNDIPSMANGVKSLFGKAIREPLKALASIILAALINWKLTIFTFVVFPLAAVCLRTLGKKVKRGAKKTLQKRANIMSFLQEAFGGIKVVKSYQMEDALQEKFAQENKKLLKYQLKVVVADSATSPIMETLIVAAGVLILGFSANLVIEGYLTTGEFCAFYAALGTMFDPIRKLADLNNTIATSIAGGERVFELMDREPENLKASNAYDLQVISNQISFDHVCFSYEPNKPILKDVTFTVKKGEKIALVGRSGAGKTTLISLIPRFYDLDSGKILIDDHNIAEISLDSLRSHIGLVTQEAFLFNDTIANNIAANTEINDLANIIQAAESAYAHSFIKDLSNQYNTLYGANGIDLSGGQKHRISLARAMYKQPEILILDEAMANLDAESESYILDALETFTKDRTTFIIAHRFSTIENVDKIVVLDEGRLIGFDSHKELIKTNDLYRHLYERQVHQSILA
jgi:subfamily B ATP-binding cassette protein MsbA